MTILDHSHRPHPWRKIRAVVTKHGDDDATVEVQVRDTGQPSIHDWLMTGERAPSAHELSPSTPMLPLVRRQVTVHRELDDDEQLAVSLLSMEREVHAVADRIADKNDTRATLLTGRLRRLDERVGAMLSANARAWEAVEDALRSLVVTRRRRKAVTPLVQQLGTLVRLGDVSEGVAVAVMNLRARYLHAVDAESQRIPKLTPELLAVMDAERRKVVVHAPSCRYDGCTGCVVMPDEEGGYEVQLPGVDHLMHFEKSELEFTAAGAV